VYHLLKPPFVPYILAFSGASCFLLLGAQAD
jgi:hypothetical protein